MKLLELFSKKVDYTITKDSRKDLHAEAMIGGRRIEVIAYRRPSGMWELDFVQKNDEGQSTTFPTGSGSAGEVFGFVMQIMKLLVEKNPDLIGIHFTASMKSRVDLYVALVKRYAPPGFKVTIDRHDAEDADFYLRNTAVKDAYWDPRLKA